jgi:hypothetical protein
MGAGQEEESGVINKVLVDLLCILVESQTRSLLKAST